MDIEEIRLAQARWTLGLLYPERLPDLACAALAADIDSPSLRLLAGENRPSRTTVMPIFNRALSELGLGTITQDEARLIVGRSWAKQIVAGVVTPYEGAKAIWRECCDLMGPRTRLDVFLSLGSEHEDFLLRSALLS
jgi:hypothetical protein